MAITCYDDDPYDATRGRENRTQFGFSVFLIDLITFLRSLFHSQNLFLACFLFHNFFLFISRKKRQTQKKTNKKVLIFSLFLFCYFIPFTFFTFLILTKNSERRIGHNSTKNHFEQQREALKCIFLYTQ